jgi:hypothetical protein
VGAEVHVAASVARGTVGRVGATDVTVRGLEVLAGLTVAVAVGVDVTVGIAIPCVAVAADVAEAKGVGTVDVAVGGGWVAVGGSGADVGGGWVAAGGFGTDVGGSVGSSGFVWVRVGTVWRSPSCPGAAQDPESYCSAASATISAMNRPTRQ